MAIWIPRRHLETWVRFYAHGGAVNESASYKLKVKDADFPSAAERFGKDLKQRFEPADALDSLVAAFKETERIRGRPARSPSRQRGRKRG